MNQNVEILIVTGSVVLQQGLGALLESLPGVKSAKSIRDLTNAYPWIEAHQPRIVFIDSDVLRNDPEAALEKVRECCPTTQKVLLVDEVEQVILVPRYANAILVKGSSPAAVASIATDLLMAKGDEQTQNARN